jgi:hypothetical protein
MSSSAAGILAAAPFAIVVARWFRSHRPNEVDRARARARAAALVFRAATSRPSTDLADAFAEFVATCLDCSTRTVIGPDLSTRLAHAGVSHGRASRAADVLDELIASRYDGVAEDLVERARELVDDLAAELRDRGGARGDQA